MPPSSILPALAALPSMIDRDRARGREPIPKPGPRRRAGIVTTSDGRVKTRTNHRWQQKREAKFNEAKGRCQDCGGPAPLHDVLHPSSGYVLIKAGDAHHIEARGLGGGKRDDRLENLIWLDRKCHRKRHEAKKAVPRKEL